jgi:nucleotide-binding universal stress UspA family protein
MELVYVAHLTSTVMLSADAIAEMETDFDEIEQELRAQAAEELGDRVESWGFQRLQGLIAEELIAVAATIGESDADGTVVIVVGSSSHAAHRVVGSVAVNLARHSPVPLVIVP